ncbi:MAG TPA: protein kinase [Kofleriaceae bacterium]
MTDLDLSGRKLGEFVLRERIGAGGYGTVYRAEQPALQREAVVKVLRPRWRNDAAPERFLREAQLASRLDHPYAAHVYSFGVEDDDDALRWIAMELVHGITLAEWLRSRGSMPFARFVPFFECVAQVVQAAHARGIVHRDLKPSNIMVLESGGQLFPKLLDFGVAKLLEDPDQPGEDPEDDGARSPADAVATVRNRAELSPERTITGPDCGPGRLTPSHGAVIGSVPYMSPEQWDDPRNVGPATDLYSLGCVAYEALTGHPPFMPETSGGYYELHRRAEPPPLGDGFPPGVDQALRRALAKSSDARHANALELAAELRAVLRAEPREQLRVSAQQWHDRGRPAAMLWHDDVLAALEQWMQRSARSGALTVLELEFVEASKGLAAAQSEVRRRRNARLHLATAALAFAGAAAGLGALQWRTVERARNSQQVSEAQRAAAEVTAELEQGRAALLHGEMDEAQRHLGEAWRRGERSSSTAFMLARAMQPFRAELARFKSTSGPMWSATFSPDGRQTATTDDRSAQIWNAENYQQLFPLPHEDIVYHAVYTSDGARLITAAGDGAVRIWNAATGSLVRELRLHRHSPRYYRAAVSPDSKLVAAIDTLGRSAVVWNTATGAVLAELANDGSERPSIAFSPDGRWLATGGGSYVCVFDTRRWRQVLAIPGPKIQAISWDPTGPRLLTGSVAGDASIWAIPGGARLHHMREIGEPVDAVVFSPDGRLVAAASRDGLEEVFDPSSDRMVSRANYLHSKILSIEFDPASRLVVAAGERGTTVVGDAMQGISVAALEGPKQRIRAVHFEPGARRVIGASWEGTAYVWDVSAPYRRWSSLAIADSCDLFGGVVPDGRFLAIGCVGHPTRVWDTARDQLLAELPAVVAPSNDFAAAFPAVSVAGDLAAVARGNAVELYGLPGGRPARTIDHGAPVTAVAFGEGHDVVSGAADGSIRATHDAGDPVPLPPASAGIDAVACLRDGRVVVADAAGHIRIVDRGVVVAELHAPARVRSLRLSPDGARLVAIASYTGNVAPPTLWALDRPRLVAELDGHAGQVLSARFVEDGRGILTAANDGVVRLWDAATGRLRQTFQGTSRFLADATLDTAGKMLVAGDGDGSVRWWDVATGRPLWTLQVHKSIVVGLHFEGDDLLTRGFAGDVSRWTIPPAKNVIDRCDACGIVAP